MDVDKHNCICNLSFDTDTLKLKDGTEGQEVRNECIHKRNEKAEELLWL